MLTFIESPDDVIALTVTGAIKADDLDAILDHLDAVMARHETVHVFVETQGIEGVQLSGLPSYIVRATPLFGKLKRFGRVAVVADQAWIRAGTRVESAILPFVGYKVYPPARAAG